MPQIIFNIPDEKLEDYKKYFLMVYPNQTLDSDNPLTDNQWIKHRIFLFAIGAYKRGKQQEFENQNGPIFDEDIIQEV
jgi:hypothetical protein